MPTPLDHAMKSKNAVLAFGGLIAGAAIWSIWGGDIFPASPDPTGDPETWTREELRRWLALRQLFPKSSETTEQLLARVKANIRP